MASLLSLVPGVVRGVLAVLFVLAALEVPLTSAVTTAVGTTPCRD